MQDLLEELKELLGEDGRFVGEDGSLLKNLIIEHGLKLDRELLQLLLSKDRIRGHFFVDVEGTLVFDKEKFLQLINNKDFLPDSYTTFKNKIGLVDKHDDGFISRSGQVALVWPYKDCVLEGGQTKEEGERDEIFWNKTLAPDDVNRLLDPKVITSFMRVTSEGENTLQELDPQDNLIIKGNNLLVLHSLVKRLGGSVKMAYIDPPFNTENGTFRYNDRFNHSTWLTFMSNRLEILRALISPSGAVFIHIDDNEHAYLKVLCDEIFGRENFLGNIAYERSGVSGIGQGGTFLVNTHEYILCYAREKSSFELVDDLGEYPLQRKDMIRYNKILVSPGEREEVARFIAPSTDLPVVIYRHSGEEIETISMRSFREREEEIRGQYLDNFDRIFRTTSVQEENEFQNRILSYCDDGLYSADYTVSRGRWEGQEITAYYLNGSVFAWLRDSAKVKDGQVFKTNRLSDFWSHGDIPKADLANEGGVQLRRGKKPESLLHRLLRLTTETGDIVLDCFLGSGTTAAVAHKMGRQYVGIEQLEYGENDSVVRLKNVINGDQTGISDDVDWEGGGDFVYCELLEWNERYVQRIMDVDSESDAEAIWDELQDRAFLSYRVGPEAIAEHAKAFSDLTLDEKKRFLLEVLDHNALYVNLSEIGDSDYGVSEEDKRLNAQFYEKES